MTKGRQLRLGLLALVLCCPWALPERAVAEGPAVLELKGAGVATALRRMDVNADGIVDLLIGTGRTVRIWSGRKGRLPSATPTWTINVRKDASFATFLAAKPTGEPQWITLGGGRITHHGIDPKTGGSRPLQGLAWADAKRVTFLDLQQPAGELLIPEPAGWRLEASDGTALTRLHLEPEAHVGTTGRFLEDTTTVIRALPHVEIGRSPGADADAKRRTLWAISGKTLVAQQGAERTTYNMAFLPAAGDPELIDLNTDGRPDVLHHVTTAQGSAYTFFETKPRTAGAEAPPSHAPANGALALAGYPVARTFVDLNGDGWLDLVATTIAIDGANAVRAMVGGMVGAQTRAFLNRGGAPGNTRGRWFQSEPDATILSDIKVRIEFTYAGTLDVKRQVTIIVDGDVDGDGHLDLVIRTGPDVLSIWPGQASGGWASEPRTIKIPPLGPHADIEGYAYDADGDGKDEVFLLYRGSGRTPERLFLVSLSK